MGTAVGWRLKKHGEKKSWAQRPGRFLDITGCEIRVFPSPTGYMVDIFRFLSIDLRYGLSMPLE
jgi:hypothetical protein